MWEERLRKLEQYFHATWCGGGGGNRSECRSGKKNLPKNTQQLSYFADWRQKCRLYGWTRKKKADWMPKVFMEAKNLTIFFSFFQVVEFAEKHGLRRFVGVLPFSFATTRSMWARETQLLGPFFWACPTLYIGIRFGVIFQKTRKIRGNRTLLRSRLTTKSWHQVCSVQSA